MRLYHKTALITGATRKAGIGAAIAKSLAEAGINLFITHYRPYDENVSGLAGSKDETEQLLSELWPYGVQAEALSIDLSDPKAPSRLFDYVEAAIGPVDILVNNAAHSERDGWKNLTPELIDNHYAVNMRGTMLLCAEFVRRFNLNLERVQPLPDGAVIGGRIINLTSGQSLAPMPGELSYVATKGAIEAFSLSLSAEVAPLNITVNCVDPGITDTGWISPDLRAEFVAQAPMGRLGLPTDAARLVRFLASDEAEWLTGQVVRSRGGQ